MSSGVFYKGYFYDTSLPEEMAALEVTMSENKDSNDKNGLLITRLDDIRRLLKAAKTLTDRFPDGEIHECLIRTRAGHETYIGSLNAEELRNAVRALEGL